MSLEAAKLLIETFKSLVVGVCPWPVQLQELCLVEAAIPRAIELSHAVAHLTLESRSRSAGSCLQGFGLGVFLRVAPFEKYLTLPIPLATCPKHAFL